MYITYYLAGTDCLHIYLSFNTFFILRCFDNIFEYISTDELFHTIFYLYKKVTFIGIHVRRTDYQAYLHYKFGAKKFAEVAYFQKAVEHMRSYIATEEVSAAFIIASDDPRWCFQTLIPALQEDLQV